MTTETLPTNPEMKEAFAAVGIKPPSTRFAVWTWLKERPRQMGSDVASSLNMPKDAVSAAISQLQQKGMIKGSREWSEHAKREMTYYSAVGATYGAAPRSPVGVKKGIRPTLVAPSVIALPVPAVDKAKLLTAESLLATLPVREAQALYMKLREIFEPKP